MRHLSRGYPEAGTFKVFLIASMRATNDDCDAGLRVLRAMAWCWFKSCWRAPVWLLATQARGKRAGNGSPTTYFPHFLHNSKVGKLRILGKMSLQWPVSSMVGLVEEYKSTKFLQILLLCIIIFFGNHFLQFCDKSTSSAAASQFFGTLGFDQLGKVSSLKTNSTCKFLHHTFALI